MTQRNRTLGVIAILALLLGSVFSVGIASAASGKGKFGTDNDDNDFEEDDFETNNFFSAREPIPVTDFDDKDVEKGDVNEDESVDILDFTMLSHFVTGSRNSINNEVAADFDDDGFITWYDVVKLGNYLFMNNDVVLLGDANDDGNVDIADIAVLGQYVNKRHIMVDLENADYNEDGTIDNADRIALQDYLFGEDGPISKRFEDKARVRVQDVTKVLNSIREHDSEGFSFPVIQYTGYSDDHDGMKFVLFEKRSTSDPTAEDIIVTDRYFSGTIGLANGVRYSLEGDALDALNVFAQDDTANAAGTVAVDFEDEVLSIIIDSEETRYSLDDVDRKAIKTQGIGAVIAPIAKSQNSGKGNNDLSVRIRERVDDDTGETQLEIKGKGLDTSQGQSFWKRLVSWFRFQRN